MDGISDWKTWVILLLLFGSISIRASGQTLRQVVEYTLFSNPSIKASKFQAKSTHHTYYAAIGEFLPTVDYEGVRGRERSENPILESLGEESVTLTRKENFFFIDQVLFEGGRIFNNAAERKLQYRAAKFGFYNTQQEVTLEAVEAYLNVLRFRRLEQIGINNVRRHFVTLQKVKRLQETRVGTIVEVNLAESRLALAKSNLDLILKGKKEAYHAYKAVTGYFPSKHMIFPSIPYRVLPPTLHQILFQQRIRHPRLYQEIFTQKATLRSIKVAKSAMWPRIDLELTASRNNNLDGIVGKNNDESIFVSLNYNLFRGASDFQRIKVARNNYYQSHQLLLQTMRDLVENAKNNWTNLQLDRSREKHLKAYAYKTAQVVSGYIKQYKLGKQSLFNVLDEENRLFIARSSYTNARFDKYIDVYRLLADMGVLVAQIVVPNDHTKTSYI